MGLFLSGFAEVDITPDALGLDMAGYANRRSTGVHDRLKAIACVFDDRRQKSAICVVDTVGLTAGLVKSVRDQVAYRSGPAPDRLMIAATHTHSAPSLWSDNPLNQQWMKTLEEKLVEVILRAEINRRPAKIGFARTFVDGGGRNRRDPENGPLDRTLTVARVDDAVTGEVMGAIVNYGCHATTLGLENSLLTADYPGYVRDAVRAELGLSPVVMFLNAACGDVNPGGYSAEDSAIGKIIPFRTFETAKKNGEAIGTAAAKLLGELETAGPVLVQGGERRFEMPTRERPLPADAKAAAAKAAEELKAAKQAGVTGEDYKKVYLKWMYAEETAELAAERATRYPSGNMPAEVQSIAVADAAFVAFPGELFTELGVDVRNSSPFKYVFVVTYANDLIGYFPSLSALDSGVGYEVLVSRYGKVAISRLTGWTKKLVRDLYDRKREAEAAANVPPPPTFKISPNLSLRETIPLRAKFPAIDFHLHYYSHWRPVADALSDMDAANVAYGVNQLGDSLADWGPAFVRELFGDEIRRFPLFTGFDYRKLDAADWADYLRKKLSADVAAGAKGIKIYKELGLRYLDKNGDLIAPDDPRLKPLWDIAAELKLPVLYHIADPRNAFGPVDPSNERYAGLTDTNKWNWALPGFPSHEELIQGMFRLAEANPQTTFIFPHCASLDHDLPRVTRFLRSRPNVYTDVSARLDSLGRQPRAAREFFLATPDKILWGSDDMWPNRDSCYPVWFRLMETDDEYFFAHYYGSEIKWKLYGLALPDDVLRQVYGENAARLLGLSLASTR